ncbi:MAG: ATP synthase F1 subunit delta [Vampirovibrio sp.]
MSSLHLNDTSFNIAKGYGKALFNIASERGELPAVYESLCTLSELLRDVPSLAEVFIQGLSFSEDEVASVTTPLLEAMNPWVKKTMTLMIQQEHALGIPALYESFLPFYEEAQKIGRVQVTSSILLNDTMQEALKQRLEKLFGLSKVILHSTVDPEILGGAYVEYKGFRFDATLKRKLQHLDAALAHI